MLKKRHNFIICSLQMSNRKLHIFICMKWVRLMMWNWKNLHANHSFLLQSFVKIFRYGKKKDSRIVFVYFGAEPS